MIVGTSPFSCYQLSSMKDKRRLTFNWCLVREYRGLLVFLSQRLYSAAYEHETGEAKGTLSDQKGQQRELFGEIKMLLRKRRTNSSSILASLQPGEDEI